MTRLAKEIQDDLFQGIALRDEALDRLTNCTDDREQWVERARIVAIEIARSTGRVTSDDLRRVFPPPPAMDPRIIGAVFRSKGLWRRIGWEQTKQPQAHARPIAVWGLK